MPPGEAAEEKVSGEAAVARTAGDNKSGQGAPGLAGGEQAGLSAGRDEGYRTCAPPGAEGTSGLGAAEDSAEGLCRFSSVLWLGPARATRDPRSTGSGGIAAVLTLSLQTQTAVWDFDPCGGAAGLFSAAPPLLAGP